MQLISESALRRGESKLTPPPADPIAKVHSKVSATFVLMGRDEKGRPHASRFEGCQNGRVENAARLMGLSIAVAKSDPQRTLARRLPAGRLFPKSGKAFVPFCSANFYGQLLAATGTPDMPRPAKGPDKRSSEETRAGGRQASAAGRGGTQKPAHARLGR